MKSADFLDQIDLLIRQGKPFQAFSLLKKVHASSSIAPLEAARFLRRLGHYSRGLGLLRPHLFQQGDFPKKPNAELALEYALNLSQLGLVHEARWILDRTPGETYAAHQLRGFLNLKTLDFRSAYANFARAQATPDASPYQVRIAQVNQLNALLGVFDYEKVTQMGSKLVVCLDREEFSFLAAYTRHYLSQAYAFLGDRSKFQSFSDSAFRQLELSPKQIPTQADHFEFYRGRAVGSFYLGEAAEIPHARMARLAWSLFDDYAFSEFCYLTLREQAPLSPSIRFFQERDRILKRPVNLADGRDYFEVQRLSGRPLPSGLNGLKRPQVFDLQEPRRFLKIGQLPHRILESFLSDFYQSFSVPALFQKVFPERNHFHPTLSPNLIHQGVQRLNQILVREKLPLRVHSLQDRYALFLAPSLEIRGFERLTNPDAVAPFVRMWKNSIGDQTFSSEDAAHAIGLKKRQVQNLLAQHHDAFEIVHEGRRRFYRLKC